MRGADLARLPSIANRIKQGTLEGFDNSEGVAIGRRLADQLSLRTGDSITLDDVLLAGFGGGLSWGAAVLRWPSLGSAPPGPAGA